MHESETETQNAVAVNEEAEPSNRTLRERVWAGVRSLTKKSIERFHRKAYRLLPALLPPPYRRDLAYECEHDEEENASTRVPEGDELRVPMIWGVELYGPAEMHHLYESLAKLEWGSGALREKRDDATAWIRSQRALGSGGWLNVGFVARKGSRGRSMFVHNFAPLPKEVDSLLVRIFQLTPSLTAVLIGFRLGESSSLRYEQELLRDRVRRHEPGSSDLVSIITPELQKQRSLDAVRNELRCIPATWFEKRIPGYFSKLGHRNRFPTMELLTIKEGLILERNAHAQNAFFDWKRLVANVSSNDLWTHKEGKRLQIAIDWYRSNEEGLHITAALDTSQFTESDLHPYGGRSLDTYAFITNEILEGVLLHASTIEYLKEQSRDLNSSREKLKTARLGRRHVLRALQHIHRFFDRTLGTPAVARELELKSESVGQYRHDCPEFTSPPWRRGDQPRQLADELCGNVHFLAKRLTEEERTMRAHFEQLSTVLSVRESVRAQRRMEWLTVTAVLVSVASLVLATPAARYIAEKFRLILLAIFHH